MAGAAHRCTHTAPPWSAKPRVLERSTVLNLVLLGDTPMWDTATNLGVTWPLQRPRQLVQDEKAAQEHPAPTMQCFTCTLPRRTG